MCGKDASKNTRGPTGFWEKLSKVENKRRSTIKSSSSKSILFGYSDAPTEVSLDAHTTAPVAYGEDSL